MTNSIKDIYVLSAFEMLVYKDMKKLLDEFMRLFVGYAKIDDELDKIARHDEDKKKPLQIQLIEEGKRIDNIKNEIKSYLFQICDKEVFDELIRRLSEDYTEHNEKVILKNLEDIIKERYKSFESLEKIKTETNCHAIEILDEGYDMDELFAESRSCHVGFVLTKGSPSEKKAILKQLLELLEQYDNAELKHYHENIKRTKDIDFEFEPGLNLYSFAKMYSFDDIVDLIKEYKGFS